MFQSSSPVSNGKWIFWLAMVILVAFFALGFNVKDANWLNGKIASATAEGMNMTTEIERQKAELNLEILRNHTALQIAQETQQAEYEKVQKQQELDSFAVAEAQKADFRSRVFGTLADGLMFLMVAISVVLGSLGIATSFGLHKILLTKAQAVKNVQLLDASLSHTRSQHFIAVQDARKREREERQRKINRRNLIRNTKPIWTSDDHSDGQSSRTLPLGG